MNSTNMHNTLKHEYMIHLYQSNESDLPYKIVGFDDWDKVIRFLTTEEHYTVYGRYGIMLDTMVW